MLDTWEVGWDTGPSCWTLGREAGASGSSCWTLGRQAGVVGLHAC